MHTRFAHTEMVSFNTPTSFRHIFVAFGVNNREYVGKKGKVVLFNTYIYLFKYEKWQANVIPPRRNGKFKLSALLDVGMVCTTFDGAKKKSRGGGFFVTHILGVRSFYPFIYINNLLQFLTLIYTQHTLLLRQRSIIIQVTARLYKYIFIHTHTHTRTNIRITMYYTHIRG